MNNLIKIGVIGDFDPGRPSHAATNLALEHAAAALSVTLASSWIPTESLALCPPETVRTTLNRFDGLWCAPGSPYRSMDGALAGIRFAREQGWPFLGTCGGFQHALLEYARHVSGIEDAEHEEIARGGSNLVIAKLACSLAGDTRTIKIIPGSLVHGAYGREETVERFVCGYGLNHCFRHRIEQGPLKVTGVDLEGEVRIVEIAGHPFYVATLFQPQLSSDPETSHPLILAFIKAAMAFRPGHNKEDVKHP